MMQRISILSLSALILFFWGGGLAALPLEVGFEGYNASWSPDAYKRARSIYKNSSLGLGDFSSPASKSSSGGNFFLRVRDKSKRFMGFLSTGKTKISTSYKKVNFFSSFSALGIPVNAAYERREAVLRGAFFFVPGKFGVGLGLRRMDIVSETSELALYSYRKERDIASSSGPELSVYGEFELNKKIRLSIRVSGFNLRGPYKKDSYDAGYLIDLYTLAPVEPYVEIASASPASRVSRSGEELDLQFRHDISAGLNLIWGLSHTSSRSQLKNHETNAYFFMNTPGYSVLFDSMMSKITEQFLFSSVYRKKNKDSFTKIYMGVSYKFGG